MAEITDAELKELLENSRLLAQRVKDLEGVVGDGQSAPRVLKRITERRVVVRMVDGKVVLGYHNRGTEARPAFVYEKPNPKKPSESINFVDLILEGMQKGEYITVEDREFRRETEKVTCKIVRTEEKEWTINQGTVRKKDVEEYSMIELDYIVPVDIVGKTRWYVVELPEEKGRREVTLHESMVNI